MQSQSFACGFCYRNIVTRQVFSENMFFSMPASYQIASVSYKFVVGMDNISVRGNSSTKTYPHSTTRIQKTVLEKNGINSVF